MPKDFIEVYRNNNMLILTSTLYTRWYSDSKFLALMNHFEWEEKVMNVCMLKRTIDIWQLTLGRGKYK
jgi:hypothetical protein